MTQLLRIQNALEVVAVLVGLDEDYLPIFLRLEEELENAQNNRPDPLTRARLAAQRVNTHRKTPSAQQYSLQLG
jgi:hypothetical protein